MPTVVVELELYKRIEEAAVEHEASTDEIFAEAVRSYLWDLRRRKISEESKIYRQRYPELKDRYLGQYIAMHKGQVVDHDTDFKLLRQRVRKRFGRTPVLMTLVKDSPEWVLVRHGFRAEADSL